MRINAPENQTTQNNLCIISHIVSSPVRLPVKRLSPASHTLVNLCRETVVKTAISPYCVRFILSQVSRHTRPLFMRCVSVPVKKNDSFFLFSAARLPLSDESESGEIWASNKPSCSPKTNKASVLCLVMKAHSHVKGVFLLVATDALIQH